jgi:hypothetical protein
MHTLCIQVCAYCHCLAIHDELYHSLWIIYHLPKDKDRQRSKLSVLYENCPSSISIVIYISRAQKFSISILPWNVHYTSTYLVQYPSSLSSLLFYYAQSSTLEPVVTPPHKIPCPH